MFGWRKTRAEPQLELRCSFCNKDQQDVRKLIAGPHVYICDQCVAVCIEILEEDHRASAESIREGKPPKTLLPDSDAWCAFCGGVADLETALLIENRTLLCESCVEAIASAAGEAQKDRDAEQ